jgi:hypothetical protein
VSGSGRRGRIITTIGGSVVLTLVIASVALATAEHWFSGTLAASTANEGGPRHAITYVQGNADHNNFCVAGDTRGPGNYAGAGLSTALPQACASSGGVAAVSYGSPSCCQYGFIDNNNGFAISVSSATHYNW